MAGRRYLNYEETVDLIDEFMKESGIRTFCERYCKGRCCGEYCYHSKDACHKNEGRRLACSFFVCREVVRLVMTKELDNLLDRAKYEALEALRRANGQYLEAYFKPYPQRTIENYKLYKTKELKELSKKYAKVKFRITDLLALTSHAVWVERTKHKRRKKK